MRIFTVKITPPGYQPHFMSVIAATSCAALRSALTTLSSPATIMVRPA
jgi:hypothetical protein